MIVINYSYGDTGLGRIGHQVEVSAYGGWGDALNASIDGQATVAESCTRESASFPAKPLKPLNSWRAGEAFFDTTATAIGAEGKCRTVWYLTFTNGAYTPAVTDYYFAEFRCDNNTGARVAIGCVIPWYASALVYQQAVIPAIVSHVERAQASGLPGGSFDDPLTRNTVEAAVALKRLRACGDAPSITDKSCDEYPIATAQEGLVPAGRSGRRTFDGCDLPNIPSGTGPKGVSICMVSDTENRSQGGTNTQFFRAERMLEGDPFRVLTS
ncbi:hypothetical protein ACFWBR_38095 [Streptomyces sp. NPDC060006]|uniref:NucA/NucB deoxyribonuclease domain-containing protein n=1 Tax=unclassified Streptomyces TaxID=2593676 RepID=UPI0036BEE62A